MAWPCVAKQHSTVCCTPVIVAVNDDAAAAASCRRMLAHELFVDVFEMRLVAESAIASWGYLDNETMSNMTNSGLGGLQPRRTLIQRNWVHEIGHIQKQSSFYFQAITAETTIENNVVFNIPRAGIKYVKKWRC